MKAGEKYGRLTAIKETRKNHNYLAYWLFKCDCGNEKELRANSVKAGEIKSCGCLQKEVSKKNLTTHGGSYTNTYKTWQKMRARCLNKNDKHYYNYGGRGITICERWNDFANFLEDMGERKEGMSLDRIDSEKGYCKENCRWATKIEQQNNRRDCHYVEINGVKKTLTEWSRIYNIKVATINYRIRNGMTDVEAITTPKRINQFK